MHWKDDMLGNEDILSCLRFDTYHAMHCREEQGARLKLMRKRIKDLRVWLMLKTW